MCGMFALVTHATTNTQAFVHSFRLTSIHSSSSSFRRVVVIRNIIIIMIIIIIISHQQHRHGRPQHQQQHQRHCIALCCSLEQLRVQAAQTSLQICIKLTLRRCGCCADAASALRLALTMLCDLKCTHVHHSELKLALGVVVRHITQTRMPTRACV